MRIDLVDRAASNSDATDRANPHRGPVGFGKTGSSKCPCGSIPAGSQARRRERFFIFDVRRSEEDRKVSVNRTQGFAPVPEDVRNFHIGGYRALDKCLKSRKGRKHFSPQDRDAGLSDPYRSHPRRAFLHRPADGGNRHGLCTGLSRPGINRARPLELSSGLWQDRSGRFGEREDGEAGRAGLF